MKRNLLLLPLLLSMQVANASNIDLLKEMFTKTAVEKNAQAIPKYYDQNFELFSNGKTMNYAEYLAMHTKTYRTSIQYQVEYDEATLIEQGNKVAARVFITTKTDTDPAHKIEVMLIAEYKDKKLLKLWELTYPDWSKLKAFKNTGEK